MKKAPRTGCHYGVAPANETSTFFNSPQAKFFQANASEVQKVINEVSRRQCEASQLGPYLKALNADSILNLLDEGPDQDVGSVIAFMKAQLKFLGVRVNAETPAFARY